MSINDGNCWQTFAVYVTESYLSDFLTLTCHRKYFNHKNKDMEDEGYEWSHPPNEGFKPAITFLATWRQQKQVVKSTSTMLNHLFK